MQTVLLITAYLGSSSCTTEGLHDKASLCWMSLSWPAIKLLHTPCTTKGGGREEGGGGGVGAPVAEVRSKGVGCRANMGAL